MANTFYARPFCVPYVFVMSADRPRHVTFLTEACCAFPYSSKTARSLTAGSPAPSAKAKLSCLIWKPKFIGGIGFVLQPFRQR
ncbi:hypothetical protein KCP74_24000 [Salmonella enterica subsp. enterica]|nr:hypothetical protein KCP74_24000 [Salmonella enterica subsp. enterica]